jgi:PhoH-like ATPase
VYLVDNFDLWNDWYGERKIKIEKVTGDTLPQNSGVILKGDGNTECGVVKGDYIVPTKDYTPKGIRPKNEEQRVAFHLLKENKIPLKIISGVAGSGKTLAACAHALHHMESRKSNIKKIVIAKSMTPVGREIGHLKGDMKEKVRPWLGPFYDNFLQCGVTPYEIDDMMHNGELEITPITFSQGRSITDAIIIIDEVQNLPMDVIKQIVTRAAEGSQIILLGDQTQKFERGIKDLTLNNLIEKSGPSPLVGHVHLSKSLRSAIADWAVQTL